MSRARTLANLGNTSLATDAELSAAVSPLATSAALTAAVAPLATSVALTAAVAPKADKVAARNVPTTAPYTLVIGDSAGIVEMNFGTANTLTVPLDSSVNFPIGASISLIQVGVGQTTVAATGGVTLNATPGLKLRAQWSLAVLIKRAANTWVLAGDVVA